MSPVHLNQNTSDASPARARWQAAGNVGVVATFLSLLWLPLMGQISGLGTSGQLTENRRASAFPTVELKSLGRLPWPRKQSLEAFPAAFEAFYNDSFGFRRPLLWCYNRAVVAGCMPGLLASSAGKPRPEAPALVGQHGWIYCTRDDDVETYRCTRSPGPSELAQWSRVLLERQAWLAERNIRYLFVVPPSKLTVYPEYLPRAIQRVGKVSRVEQLAAELGRRGAPEMFLDMRDAVLAGKREYAEFPCYYRTDTHWNELGGYFGYRSLIERLQQWYPNLQPADFAEFDVQCHEGPPLVLAELMDTVELFTDTHLSLQPRSPRQARTVFSSHPTKDEVAKSISENLVAPPGRVVVLHDSFMLAMQPFFNEHWQNVHYFWTREFPYEEIERLQPDLVIQEMVEQVITGHEPANPSGMQMMVRPRELARRQHRIER